MNSVLWVLLLTASNGGIHEFSMRFKTEAECVVVAEDIKKKSASTMGVRYMFGICVKGQS